MRLSAKLGLLTVRFTSRNTTQSSKYTMSIY